MEIKWAEYSDGIVFRNTMGYIIKQQAFRFFFFFVTIFHLIFLVLVLKLGAIAITEQHPNLLFKALIREVHTLDLLEQRIFDLYLSVPHCVVLKRCEQKVDD